ncbi:hypothetical protein BGP_4179 [Beggiatoa sp. PS]|nr:hypothetical protein BGP_4179 [Beggiatoa sp. PS]
MRAACKNNIEVKANIMIGFPGEKKRDTLPNTLFFIKMAWVGVQDATCFPFSPYPGSELFQQLIDKGCIKLDDDYLRSLFNYQPLTKTDSYSEYMSDRFVTYCTLFNMAVFYAFSLLFRPVRAWHLFNNLIIHKKPVSRLETAIFRLMQRNKQKLPD